jgi:hypothetical protein
VHLDVKHLPKLRNRDGITPKRSLYVAIDRCSRWVHLAVKNNETTASATAFLKEAIRAFPSPSRTCSPTGAPASWQMLSRRPAAR